MEGWHRARRVEGDARGREAHRTVAGKGSLGVDGGPEGWDGRDRLMSNVFYLFFYLHGPFL